ncbi:MAG: DivIVA domain-containing protein [Defluviitaleaceae bacterium]|nr:DivIVA domain-containing protein [Defluviitaleaceae bacterium]
MTEKFAIVKRGYDTAEVDNYIEQLEVVIRSYKEKDQAINNALISAQITASKILKEAEESAVVMKAGAVAKLDAITASVAVQKRMIKGFQDDYNHILKKYLHEIDEAEILGLYSKVQDLEEYMDSLAAEGTPKTEAENAPADGEKQSGWL